MVRRGVWLIFAALVLLGASCACQSAPPKAKPCDPALRVKSYQQPWNVNPDGVSQFGAFTGCVTPQRNYPILAKPATPAGWNDKPVQQRLSLRYNTLTTNKLGGFDWPHPGNVTVRYQGGTATIDLPADFYDGVIVAPGSSFATGLPVFWTGFLESSVTEVHLTLGGDAEALADRWESTLGATKMTRTRYEHQLATVGGAG